MSKQCSNICPSQPLNLRKSQCNKPNVDLSLKPCSSGSHTAHRYTAAVNCSVLKMKDIMLMKTKSNEFYKTLNYKYQNIQTHVTQWIFFFTTPGGRNKPTDGNCPCTTPCRRAHSSVQHSRDKKFSVPWKQPHLPAEGLTHLRPWH